MKFRFQAKRVCGGRGRGGAQGPEAGRRGLCTRRCGLGRKPSWGVSPGTAVPPGFWALGPLGTRRQGSRPAAPRTQPPRRPRAQPLSLSPEPGAGGGSRVHAGSGPERHVRRRSSAGARAGARGAGDAAALRRAGRAAGARGGRTSRDRRTRSEGSAGGVDKAAGRGGAAWETHSVYRSPRRRPPARCRSPSSGVAGSARRCAPRGGVAGLRHRADSRLGWGYGATSLPQFPPPSGASSGPQPQCLKLRTQTQTQSSPVMLPPDARGRPQAPAGESAVLLGVTPVSRGAGGQRNLRTSPGGGPSSRDNVLLPDADEVDSNTWGLLHGGRVVHSPGTSRGAASPAPGDPLRNRAPGVGAGRPPSGAAQGATALPHGFGTRRAETGTCVLPLKWMWVTASLPGAGAPRGAKRGACDLNPESREAPVALVCGADTGLGTAPPWARAAASAGTKWPNGPAGCR